MTENENVVEINNLQCSLKLTTEILFATVFHFLILKCCICDIYILKKKNFPG